MGYTASKKRRKVKTGDNVHIWENKKNKSTVKNYRIQSSLREN